jgi:sulfite exporter TauE/SafE
MWSSVAEFGLIFVSGVLGSAHCIGMCGGIAATMSLGTKSVVGAMLRQGCWSLGRTLTYVFLGIAAAALGARFLKSQGNAIWLQATFAIVAGVLLIVQGMHAAGWLKWRVRRNNSLPCVTRTVFSQFFQGGSSISAFIAGLVTGFLPCGLVYSFLALAASSGHVGKGMLIMLSFGLGTVPVMLVTGAGLSLATIGIRKKLIRVAGISVLVTGLMTTARGISFAANHDGATAADSCPICLPGDNPVTLTTR